jgi:hypothetical protein
MRVKLLIAGALAALAAVPAASAKQPPGPSASALWAPGVSVSYTETVRDGLGRVIAQTHREGIPAGTLFGSPGGGASLVGSDLAHATAVDAGSDLATAGAASTRRLAGCCSSSGSDTVDFTVTKTSITSWFVAWRYHQVKHWCWQYPNITCLNVGSNFYDVDANGQVRYDSSGYGWYYTWAGGPFGGHYSHREGKIDNCILRIGCIGSYYPYVDIWVNGNGAWTASGGGN